jgi:hypothetical protein
VIGYGPQLKVGVEAIAALDVLCVAGNHKSIVSGEPPVEQLERLEADHRARASSS